MQFAFWTVMMTSLYAGAVGLVLLVIKKLLKNRINAQWHYLLWLVLVMKLLIPFGPESAVSLFNVLPQSVPETMGQIARQETNLDQLYVHHQRSTDTMIKEKTQLPVTRSVEDVSLRYAARLEPIVPYLWFAGMALMLGWFVLSYGLMHLKIWRTSTDVPEKLQNITDVCCRKMGVNRKVGIILQSAIGTPALVGMFHPKVLMPANISEMGDRELEFVILHELAHYRRKDVIVNYLLLALQVVHWFNPIIWYCFKKIREDMEVAADEMVLEILDTCEHKEYGRALLGLIESFSCPRFTPRLIGMADEKKNIEKRIRMIKGFEFLKNRRKMVIGTGVVCSIVLCSLLLTNATSAQKSIPATAVAAASETMTAVPVSTSGTSVSATAVSATVVSATAVSATVSTEDALADIMVFDSNTKYGDVNGDGKDEKVVLENDRNCGYTVLVESEDGKTLARKEFFCDTMYDGYVLLADIDDDGKKDVFIHIDSLSTDITNKHHLIYTLKGNRLELISISSIHNVSTADTLKDIQVEAVDGEKVIVSVQGATSPKVCDLTESAQRELKRVGLDKEKSIGSFTGSLLTLGDHNADGRVDVCRSLSYRLDRWRYIADIEIYYQYEGGEWKVIDVVTYPSPIVDQEGLNE